MEIGYTHQKAVIILYGLSVVFGLLAVVAVIAQNDRVSMGLVMAGIAGFVIMKCFVTYVPLTGGL